jgi:DNA ligase-1
MDSFARACDDTLRYSSRLKKIAILGAYLRGLADDDLTRAIRFLLAQPAANAPATLGLFETQEPQKLSVGRRPVWDAVRRVTGWDDETLSICYREVGDSGEAAALLLTGRTESRPMTLEQAEQVYLRLHAKPRAEERTAILTEVLRKYVPLTLKYFLKVMSGGFRIGLQEKLLEEAVAEATGRKPADVRAANNRLGNLAVVALAARRDELHTIEARLFHPMDFMLAKPLDSVSDLEAPEDWFVEDKYDGMRSQIHLDNGRVQIYTRGLEEATTSFPEIAAALATIQGTAILDGEILAWRDGRALSFTVLQQRLQRKKITQSLIESVPVVFMAYDLLYRDGVLLLDRPFEFRRELLSRIDAGSPKFLISNSVEAADLNSEFEGARLRGNEGLVLKRKGSTYEPGRRGGAWLKVKRAFATLDVVITAAEQGHGKRATVLSDYTFAVRTADGQFVNVGKAYSGLTDNEIRELTRILRSLATGRYSRVLLVKPEIVLEVAFDGIQKSPRHKSGYALRFPRIARWRTDKRPEDCDTLERVAELYASSLNLTASREGEG